MMTVLLVLLYLCIGAIVTFALCRLYVIVEPYNKYDGFEDGYIMVGVFWIVAAPFAFAVFFAKYGEKLKKRGKAE
jgi:hypothetical protein